MCYIPLYTEYLSTAAVKEQGELRRAAVEKYLEAKFAVLLKSAIAVVYVGT